MKSTSLALIITTATLLASASVHATEPRASATGVVAIQNTIRGSLVLGSNGTSSSFASNAESAFASVRTTANHQPNYTEVNAGTSGKAGTDSASSAYNVSTGSGKGSASSAGGASTMIDGTAAIHGVTQGFNGANASMQTNNRIVAGTNQGSYAEGQTRSGFDMKLHFDRGNDASSVKVSDDKSAYVSAASSTGALTAMNAAGLANIGASGHFFARASLAGSTGTSTAP